MTVIDDIIENMKTDTETETETEDARPPVNWNVFYINDDYTSFDFVVDTLQSQFGKSAEEAINITTSVHQTGKGLAGTYVREVAETKATHVVEEARMHDFPLMLVIEPAPN